MFTRSDLARLWPEATDAKVDGVMAVAADVFKEFGIFDEPLVIAHCMAQISHENGGGTITRENMNYTTAKQLLKIFGQKHSAKIQPYETAKYLRNPKELAERAYGLDNPTGKKQVEFGHTKRGQAYMYRGNGDIQLTGLKAHLKAGTALKLDLVGNPELLQDPKISFRVAVWEFKILNAIAPARRDEIEIVTQRINGGQNGIADRRKWLARWKAALEIDEDVVEKSKAKAEPKSTKKPLTRAQKAKMIKFGDEGPEVIVVQENLRRLGYFPGNVDGKFSTNVRKVVLAFQADNDLDTDGIVGPETMGKLLDASTPPAVISEERANTTADDLRAKGSETIKQADKVGFWAKVLAALGIGGGAEELGVLDKAESLVGQGQQARTIFDGVKEVVGGLASYWWIAAIVLGVYFVYVNRQVIFARVEAARTGANLGAS